MKINIFEQIENPLHYNKKTQSVQGDLKFWLLPKGDPVKKSDSAGVIFSVISNAIFNEDGYCTYSNKLISDYLHKSTKVVSNCLRTIKDSGWIQIGFDHRKNIRYIVLGRKAFDFFFEIEVEDFEYKETTRPLIVKKSKINPKKRFKVLERDSFTCQYCGEKAPYVKLEVDHIVPKSKGGPSKMENLTTSCWECNIGKSNMILN